MKKLITATGKEFECMWCGVSYAGQFFAGIAGSTFSELSSVFQEQEETETLIYDDTKQQTEYAGYTQLIGLQMDWRDNIITVNLIPKGEQHETAISRKSL